MIPSFAGIGESVSDVLEELRDAGCDLYVHDAGHLESNNQYSLASSKFI